MKSDAPKTLFSIREAVLLIVLVAFIIPIAVFLPFIVMRLAGIDVSKFGLNGNRFFFLVLLSQCVGFIFAIVAVWRRLKRSGHSWSEVGLRKVGIGRSVSYIAGYYCFALLAIVGLAILLNVIGAKPSNESTAAVSVMYGPLWSNVLITVIIASVVEEILFRGILLEGLLRTMRPFYAISIGALVFVFSHVDPVTIIMLLPLAFYINYMYFRLRSIYPTIMLHASWNLIVLFLQR